MTSSASSTSQGPPPPENTWPKFHCKNWATENCPKWVWFRDHECGMCLAGPGTMDELCSRRNSTDLGTDDMLDWYIPMEERIALEKTMARVYEEGVTLVYRDRGETAHGGV